MVANSATIVKLIVSFKQIVDVGFACTPADEMGSIGTRDPVYGHLAVVRTALVATGIYLPRFPRRLSA